MLLPVLLLSLVLVLLLCFGDVVVDVFVAFVVGCDGIDYVFVHGDIVDVDVVVGVVCFIVGRGDVDVVCVVFGCCVVVLSVLVSVCVLLLVVLMLLVWIK